MSLRVVEEVVKALLQAMKVLKVLKPLSPASTTNRRQVEPWAFALEARMRNTRKSA
jgi:hypothetical protein